MLIHNFFNDTYTTPSAEPPKATRLEDLAGVVEKLNRRLEEIAANSPIERIKKYADPWMYVGSGISDEFCDLVVKFLEGRGVKLNGWQRSPIFESNTITFIDLAKFRWK